ncbi:hypothetical protein H2198_007121 [Neophaeococcomyces mojaviensis]|uniref:Uncharacterized protein n=1 Tax=Neophaeococcomyces mojaviensis TaxID=3383035 RepID=A0ACC3A107_9EURO|nr:hypothetical protein H2198_007121 [Knufia sp. JES_112]
MSQTQTQQVPHLHVANLAAVSVVDPLESREHNCPICMEDIPEDFWKEGEVLRYGEFWQHDSCGACWHSECARTWLKASCLCSWCRQCLRGHIDHRLPSRTFPRIDRREDGPYGRWMRYWADRSNRRVELEATAFEQQPGYTAQQEFREAVVQAQFVQQQRWRDALARLREAVRSNVDVLPHSSITTHGPPRVPGSSQAIIGNNVENFEARHQSLQAVGGWNALAARNSDRAVTNVQFENEWAQANAQFEAAVRAARRTLATRREDDLRRDEWEEDPSNPF